MRVFLASILALGLVVPSALADAGAAKKDDHSTAAGSSSDASKTPASAAAPKAADSTSLENQMQQLRGLVEQQAEEIRQLREELRAHEGTLAPAAAASTSSATSAANPSGAAPASNIAQPVVASSGAPASAGVNESVANSNSGSQNDRGDAPATINIKGISITPGGFLAAETVWRQHALSADVNTPFNSLPFSGSPMDHMTEFNASGRQSRISLLVEGKLSDVKIGGYYETDFLSAGTTSTYTQSDSFTMRQRQLWAQAAFDNGFTITGGQMWSLLTETKHGLDNRTEATPQTIDSQYNIGFTWARQLGFRVTKNFGDKLWLGFAVENPETTLTFHLPSGAPSTFFLVGAPGNTSGLLSPLSNDAFSSWPDFVFKAALEPGWGHYEVFGVVSSFRDRIYPCGVTPATVANPCLLGSTGPIGVGAINNSSTGGGIGANARVSLFKKIDLGVHVFGGDGVGRYGTSNLPDVTVRDTGILASTGTTIAPGTGSLALIRSYQGLLSLELHPNPKLDIYMYGGGEYAGRAQYTYNPSYPNPPSVVDNEGYGALNLTNYGCGIEQAPGSPVSTPTGVGGTTGFIPGSLANCAGDTRNILEGTFGFWYRFYKGSHGTIQWGPQYSYVQRNTWVGCAASIPCGNDPAIPTITNAQPRSIENMVFTSFRYYLP